MAGIIGWLSMVISFVGFFMGFYYLSDTPSTSLAIVMITTVGITGVLAFIRHVIFHKEDAKRLGWETERPDWMFEVGFANLAFGVMGILVVALNWDVTAQVVVLIGYSIYLIQAAILHGYRYFTDEKKSPARLWRSFLATLLYAGMMLFFAIFGLVN
jgi:uncharacterized membrane protein YfcA